MSEDQSTILTPADGQCSFFLKKKNRFCRFQPNNNQKYCAEHSLTMGVELERKRVVCPLNPSHTCYEDMLKRHIKKCNSRKKPEEVYYVEGINSGSDVEGEKVSLNSIENEELYRLIEKINKLYDEYIGTIEVDILSHSCLKEELENESYGTAAMRHRKQQASLVGHMNKLGLLQDNTRFIEMGAGKGQLSHWVERAVQDKNNISFLLVDRGCARYKFDCYHNKRENGPEFERLKIDIEHLDLDEVNSMKECEKQNVAIGKHLCGAATDLALRCLLHHSEASQIPNKKLKMDEGQSGSQSGRRNIKGVVIALCCHHRCSWKSYVGKEFMRSVNFTTKDFNTMSTMSSWATCTWKGWKAQERVKDRKAEEKKEENINDIEDEHDDNTQEDYSGAIKLDVNEREEIGRRCKRLIDFGRLQFLQKNKFIVDLKSYIDFHLTPENIVLLAHR